MSLLTENQVVTQLGTLRGWERVGKEIKKTFEHKDFVHAMGFVNSVALLAEKANHHPDIDIRWNKVSLVLSTHSAGGVTLNDVICAAKTERLFA